MDSVVIAQLTSSLRRTFYNTGPRAPGWGLSRNPSDQNQQLFCKSRRRPVKKPNQKKLSPPLIVTMTSSAPLWTPQWMCLQMCKVTHQSRMDQSGEQTLHLRLFKASLLESLIGRSLHQQNQLPLLQVPLSQKQLQLQRTHPNPLKVKPQWDIYQPPCWKPLPREQNIKSRPSLARLLQVNLQQTWRQRL